MKIPILLRGGNYRCKLVGNPEIVKGERGKYFYINLYQSDYEKILTFPSGGYVINDINKYENALAEFGENIIKILQKSQFRQGYKIYIKGSADILGNQTFKTVFNNLFRYNRVCYYPHYKQSSSLFVTKEMCVNIIEPITNDELPNLRAAFIQEKFENFYAPSIEKPKILEGTVTLDISEVDRNVVLLLFLPETFFN